jgi:hypothetical protein
VALLPACFNVEQRPCTFACGSNGECPDDYKCLADGYCHLHGDPTSCGYSDLAVSDVAAPEDLSALDQGGGPDGAPEADGGVVGSSCTMGAQCESGLLRRRQVLQDRVHQRLQRVQRRAQRRRRRHVHERRRRHERPARRVRPERDVELRLHRQVLGRELRALAGLDAVRSGAVVLGQHAHHRQRLQRRGRVRRGLDRRLPGELEVQLEQHRVPLRVRELERLRRPDLLQPGRERNLRRAALGRAAVHRERAVREQRLRRGGQRALLHGRVQPDGRRVRRDRVQRLGRVRVPDEQHVVRDGVVLGLVADVGGHVQRIGRLHRRHRGTVRGRFHLRERDRVQNGLRQRQRLRVAEHQLLRQPGRERHVHVQARERRPVQRQQPVLERRLRHRRHRQLLRERVHHRRDLRRHVVQRHGRVRLPVELDRVRRVGVVLGLDAHARRRVQQRGRLHAGHGRSVRGRLHLRERDRVQDGLRQRQRLRLDEHDLLREPRRLGHVRVQGRRRGRLHRRRSVLERQVLHDAAGEHVRERDHAHRVLELERVLVAARHVHLSVVADAVRERLLGRRVQRDGAVVPRRRDRQLDGRLGHSRQGSQPQRVERSWALDGAGGDHGDLDAE